MKKYTSTLIAILLTQSIHASELHNNSTQTIEEAQSSRDTLISKNEAWAALKEIGWYEAGRVEDSVTFVDANYIEIESAENRIVKALVRIIDHPEPLDLSAKNYVEYTELRDCNNNTVTLLKSYKYKNNKLISSSDHSNEKPTLEIDDMSSVAGGIQKDICEYLKLVE